MQTHSPRRPFAALYFALALVAWLGVGCAPSGPKALLQGEELVRKGNYEAAITKLKIATDLLRNDARAWNYLGLAYHGAGQYGEAIISYQRAQQLDQNLAAARYNLGELYLEQGNPVSAADELAIFTALQPKSVEGWVRLGDAHLQNQRLDRAQTSYYTALTLKRATPEAFNGLGLILLQRKNPRDAYRYFVEANKYDSNYAPPILNMAVVAQSHLSALPTALTKYREYLAKAPASPNASAVQAAIRQLDAELNPRPVREETRVAVAEPPAAPAPATNRPSPAVARTEAAPPRQTNAMPVTATTTAPVLVTRTNPPAATAVASAATNARPATASNRPAPATATNQPPVQVAKAEIPAAAPAAKPATEVRPATETATVSKPALVRENATTVPEEKAVANLATPRATQAETPPPAAVLEEEPPLEVVTLEEAVIQPAGEIEPATELQVATTPPPAVNPVSTAQTSPPQVARVEAPEQPERRGFFQRLNPVNLFRSDEDEASSKRSMNKVTPLPPDTSAPPTEEPVPPTPEPTTAVALARQPEASAPATPTPTPTPTPAPAPVTGPRYQYGRIKQPVADDRPTAERLFERGIGAQSRRDAGGAATFFAAAAEADPSYFAAHYNLGLASYSAGQWFKALSAFETALVLEPNSAEARYNFALTLQKSGFPVDAARELETLLGQNPEDTRAMLLLGNVYAQDLREISSARRQYQQVLALEPQHPQATAIRYWLASHP